VVPPGIHKIKHVIIIMQENRSLDSYFGTFPRATGIRSRPGVRRRQARPEDRRAARPAAWGARGRAGARNLIRDFNFDQGSRAPQLLPTNPPTDSRSIPAHFGGKPRCLGCTKTP
jgi:hypothetical protein